jgi:hypothetical protein
MRGQWTAEAANGWWATQPWLMGCNFTPSNAINQLEMWQSASFDPALIDAELALAASVGMNAVRVYLHDLLWCEDPLGFGARIERFLTIADRHGIRTMLVLFDSCCFRSRRLARSRNRSPVSTIRVGCSPRVSLRYGTSRSTGGLRPMCAALSPVSARTRGCWLGISGTNGPEVSLCDAGELAAKAELVLPLLREAFGWAREMDPIQPLTSAIWLGDWSSPERLSPLQQAQTTLSDVISFHNYGDAADFAQRIEWLRSFDRPLLCTEFMARPAGSTFAAILPVAKAGGIGAFCWGLVRGKTQTHLPWESWENPNLAGLNDKWFHDIFEADGVAHDPAEVEFLRLLNAIDARTPHWPSIRTVAETRDREYANETEEQAEAA